MSEGRPSARAQLSLRTSGGVRGPGGATKKARAEHNGTLIDKGEAPAFEDLRKAFLTSLSHDFRTPLTAIQGLAVTLLRPEVSLTQQERDDFIVRIVANAVKLEEIIGDLLDLDSLARGTLTLEARPTDTGAKVARLVESWQDDGHPITLEAEHVVASVDAEKVERIVGNMIENTFKHTPAGTHVWVKVQARDGGVVISVEDDGPGLSDPFKETAFEAFTRGELKAPNPGMGVGLSLVRRLAELHSGRAWAQDREGGGACFNVFLPDAPAQPVTPGAKWVKADPPADSAKGSTFRCA